MTTADLKIIAEYDGWNYSPYPNTPNKMYKGNISMAISDFTYHTDFNELIRVWNKAWVEWEKISRSIPYSDWEKSGKPFDWTMEQRFNKYVNDNNCQKACEVVLDALRYLESKK